MKVVDKIKQDLGADALTVYLTLAGQGSCLLCAGDEYSDFIDSCKGLEQEYIEELLGKLQDHDYIFRFENYGDWCYIIIANKSEYLELIKTMEYEKSGYENNR